MSTFNKKIIPAAEGYQALDFDKYGDKWRIHTLPVLAWAIEFINNKASVEPVCIDEMSDLYEGAIVSPLGRVVLRGREWYESTKEYYDAITRIHGPAWDKAKLAILDRIGGDA